MVPIILFHVPSLIRKTVLSVISRIGLALEIRKCVVILSN